MDWIDSCYMLLFRILISLYLYFYTDDHNELLVSETNLKFGVHFESRQQFCEAVQTQHFCRS